LDTGRAGVDETASAEVLKEFLYVSPIHIDIAVKVT
jgi:hypothetical protein